MKNDIEKLIHHSKKLNILYVEDNKEARESTLIILEEFFAHVLVAENGLEGLHLFNEQHSNMPIHILITDINMPKMDGLKMIREIQKINNDLPILVFSAYNDPEFFIETIQLGIDGYLLKPIILDQFTSFLARIVEKIKLQLDVKKTQNLLQQYKEVTDKSAIVSIINCDGIITYANEACCQLMEMSAAELIGCSYDITFNQGRSQKICNEIWETIRDKKELWQGVTQYIPKSGRVYYLKNTIKPIISEGEIIEYIALRDDISEIRLASQARERLLVLEKQQADKKNQAKSDFISRMSHELRTPMNAILGFAQILERDITLSHHQQDSVKEITHAGQHLLKLINEILDLSKIESGNIAVSLESIDLNKVIYECFTLLTPKANKQAVSLHYHYHEQFTHPIIHVDNTRLKQILLNLLDNAIKYNRDQGRVELTLLVTDKQRLRITIKDTGKGISADNMKELFLPFNRMDMESSTIEGTGVGLSICHNLVKMMDGNIGAESQLHVGSSFWVEFPLDKN